MKNRVNCLENLEGVSDHNVAGNGRREGLKTDRYETISSQATLKKAEGSTSRSWSLSPCGYGGKDPRARGMSLPMFEIAEMLSLKENSRVGIEPINDRLIVARTPDQEFSCGMFGDDDPSSFLNLFQNIKDQKTGTAKAEVPSAYGTICIPQTANEMPVKSLGNHGVSQRISFCWMNTKNGEIVGDFLAVDVENDSPAFSGKSSVVLSVVDRHIPGHGTSDLQKDFLIGILERNRGTSSASMDVPISTEKSQNVSLLFGFNFGKEILVDLVGFTTLESVNCRNLKLNPPLPDGVFVDPEASCKFGIGGGFSKGNPFFSGNGEFVANIAGGNVEAVSPVFNGGSGDTVHFPYRGVAKVLGKRRQGRLRKFQSSRIGHDWTISQFQNIVKNIMMCSGLTCERKRQGINSLAVTNRSQLRNAGRYAGEETNQQTEYKLPQEIRNGLGDWMANKRDMAIFDQIASSPTKIYYVNDRAGTSTIVAGDLCTLQQFVRAKTYAVATAYPKLPPIKIAKVGEKTVYRYVGLMHDHVAYDLSMNDPVYQQTVRDAGARGVDNPMFTGALIDYMGMLLHAHDNCPTFTTWGSGSNVAGAESYLLGRQSVIVGIGGYKIQGKNGYLKWVEKRFNKIGPFTQECVSKNAVNSGNVPYKYAMAA